MEPLARVIVHRHGSDQGSLERRAPNPRVLHCFRVLGRSAKAAGTLCRSILKSESIPTDIVLVFDQCQIFDSIHLALCEEVRDVCAVYGGDLHFCGMKKSGWRTTRLADISPNEIRSSLAVLIEELTAVPRLIQNGGDSKRYGKGVSTSKMRTGWIANFG